MTKIHNGGGGSPELDLAGNELESRVGEFIRSQGMIQPGDKVLAAVSGGVDSMVLLEVLNRLRSGLNFSLAAAYFDHGLRGEQGRRESVFVAEACAGLGVKFASGRTEDLRERAAAGENLQEAARRVRYAFLWHTAGRLGCQRLATGHQRDDQAETVLIRLISGSGFPGLAGIRPVSRSGSLIRPLLAVTRAEIETFAGNNAVAWIEDPTNASDRYLRNRLRRRLIPEIELSRDPQFRENLAALADEAAALAELLDRQAEDWIESFSAGRVELDCRPLQRLPGIVRRHILRRAVGQLAGSGRELSGRPLIALDNLVNLGRSGSRAVLPGGVQALKEFGRVNLHLGVPYGTSEVETSMDLCRNGLTVVELVGDCWQFEMVEETGRGNWIGSLPAGDKGARALVQSFDADQIDFPLRVTGWRPGDRLRPFGLGGEKKLKKLFGEKKIALGRRNGIPVVRDARGKILWVCGVSRSDYAPLGPCTRRIIRLKATKIGAGRGQVSSQSFIDTQII